MNNFIVPVVDTDSITVCKKDFSPFTEDEIKNLTFSLNKNFDELIIWEYEFNVPSLVTLKAKNYALWDGEKIKIKGSAFKSSSREIALKELMSEFLDVMLKEQLSEELLYTKLVGIYHKYILEALNVKDIKRWASKKTITEKVLNPERTNEQKLFDALQGTEYSEGDKKWVYFKTDGSLGIIETYDENYDKIKLIEKIWKTVSIFETILDIKKFPKYHLKRSQKLLEELK